MCGDIRKRVENKQVVIGFGHWFTIHRRPAPSGDQTGGETAFRRRRLVEDVTPHRRPSGNGDVGDQKMFPNPDWLFGGLLQHDGRPYRNVLTLPVCHRPRYRLGGTLLNSVRTTKLFALPGFNYTGQDRPFVPPTKALPPKPSKSKTGVKFHVRTIYFERSPRLRP